jgi:hypothetical protein
MSWHKTIKTAATTGDFDSDAAGTVNAGASVFMGLVRPGSLSAEVTVDAETNTLTMTGQWQISDDGSTWVSVQPSNNAADVTLATGTGGADAAVTVVLDAPGACYGAMYSRFTVVSGVTTGAATDTTSILYRYAKPYY